MRAFGALPALSAAMCLVVGRPDVGASTVKIFPVALHLLDVSPEPASDIERCFVVDVLPNFWLESIDLALSQPLTDPMSP